MEPYELIEFNWHKRCAGTDGQINRAIESIRNNRAERVSWTRS